MLKWFLCDRLETDFSMSFPNKYLTSWILFSAQAETNIFWALSWPMMIMDLVTFKRHCLASSYPPSWPVCMMMFCSVLQSSGSVVLYHKVSKVYLPQQAVWSKWLFCLGNGNVSYSPSKSFLYNKNYPQCLPRLSQPCRALPDKQMETISQNYLLWWPHTMLDIKYDFTMIFLFILFITDE